MRSQQARLAAGRDFSVGKELGYGLVGAHGGQALREQAMQSRVCWCRKASRVLSMRGCLGWPVGDKACKKN